VRRPVTPRICQRGIARTFQLTALFPLMSARENVRFAAQARGQALAILGRS
jgi:ABC-type branched-subunit amino acid transport system ATPase component